jgi:CBS domain-containing protein
MAISKLCQRNVVWATRDTSIVDAARLMRQHHVGAVVVVDQDDTPRMPVGIVTDRDIVVEVVAPGLDPKQLKLGDLLVDSVVTIEERKSAADTVRLMSQKGVRRVPVVTDEGALAGIVSIDDLLRHFATALGTLADLTARNLEREAETRK